MFQAVKNRIGSRLAPLQAKAFASIKQRFDYGSNSTLHLRMKEHKIEAEIEAIWDDWTDIDIELLGDETKKSHNLQILDKVEDIDINLRDYSTQKGKVLVQCIPY